jgi:pantoate--beta-alanine ligase
MPGHVSLVQGALDHGDVPVASIFVNTTQFGPNEDFAIYSRDEAGDVAKLEATGCRASSTRQPRRRCIPVPSSRP